MIIKLVAQTREIKEKLSSDFIPGVLYGKGQKNKYLKIKKNDFDKVFQNAGESNLIDLDYGSGSIKVLIKDTQRDVLKDFFIHVDFYQVNMKKKIITEIPLHFVGDSPAVKELNGILTKTLSVLVIECLPSDLVDHIDVDISVLKSFDDMIRVNDLKLPSGLNLTQHTNELIISVKELRVVEVEPEPVSETSKTTKETSSDVGSETETSAKKPEENKVTKKN